VFIASFPAGAWQTNCYVVATQPGAECVLIDPGMDALDPLAELVAGHRLKPVAVVLTHGHLDHTYSVMPLCRSHDAACWIHPDDRALLADPFAGMGPDALAMVRRLSGQTTFVEPDEVHELTDGAELTLGGVTFGAVHAPGHTPGSTMFTTDYAAQGIESVVFSGDVLFAGSIGRTDLPGGSHPDMLNSLRTRVLPLADTTAVLPGHGPQTTMARERATNPYLQPDQLPDAQPRSDPREEQS